MHSNGTTRSWPNGRPRRRSCACLRRLNDVNKPLQPDDWDAVQIHTDQVLAVALYCDRLGFPPAYAETLEAGVKAGGYHATHVLLAWIWLQDNRCKLPFETALRKTCTAPTRRFSRTARRW